MSEKPKFVIVITTIASLATIIGICIAVIALIPAFGQWLFPISPIPKPTVSYLVMTPNPQLVATITPPHLTDTLSPTDTPLATYTPFPTNTSIPSAIATVFVPPADGILFQDNFENGLKTEWQQYFGQWIASDRTLTIVHDPSTANTDAYSWIGVENPNWRNYVVSLTIHLYRPLTESDNIALVVRDNISGSKYIGFEIDFWPHIYLSIISQGSSASSPIAGNNKDFTFPLGVDANAEIRVENNNYTLSVNGAKLQTISISGYDSGGFRIGLNCKGYPRCPTFSKVKVTYLP